MEWSKDLTTHISLRESQGQWAEIFLESIPGLGKNEMLPLNIQTWH